MKYKLFKDIGIITSREAELVEDALTVRFEGAPLGATAIFTNTNGNRLYRKLDNFSCTIPTNFLVSSIQVTVSLVEEKKTWKCEELKAERVCKTITEKNRSYTKTMFAIAPNDFNLVERVVKLTYDIEELKANNDNLTKKLNELSTKITEMMEGYDIN